MQGFFLRMRIAFLIRHKSTKVYDSEFVPEEKINNRKNYKIKTLCVGSIKRLILNGIIFQAF
jgi:hypothetical protein